MTAPLYVVKQADEARSNPSAPLADDAELTLYLPPGSYMLYLAIAANVPSAFARTIAFATAFDGTFTKAALVANDKAILVDPYNINNSDGRDVAQRVYRNAMHEERGFTTYAGQFGNSAARGFMRLTGTIDVSVGGTFSLQWRVSGGGPAFSGRIYRGSYIVATPVCQYL
jgi:hypothetical protein